jgi:starvation-inducible DNA-binding protein
MARKKLTTRSTAPSATPLARRVASTEFQPYGVLASRAIALSPRTCANSVENLNRVLADTMALRDLYKKCHWQVTGPQFIALHELFDSHYEKQAELVDLIAERIAMLGGVSVAMPQDVSELTAIPRPPKGRERLDAVLARLLQAHEIVLSEAREFAEQANDDGDLGSNDLLVGQVIRTHEMQAWFVREHVE